MITWDVPPVLVPCPHCGAEETIMTLQLFGLIRFACAGCRRTFAVRNDAKATSPVSTAGAPS